jgi:plastocyanin
MRIRSHFLPAALLTAGALALAAGCSKDKGTNPYGGGGGGAPVLNLDLPSGGGAAEFTFNAAGTVTYKCGLHSFMNNNTVVVDPASANTDANVTIQTSPSVDFSPKSVTIKPGGTVHWTNPTGMQHTVVNQ